MQVLSIASVVLYEVLVYINTHIFTWTTEYWINTMWYSRALFFQLKTSEKNNSPWPSLPISVLLLMMLTVRLVLFSAFSRMPSYKVERLLLRTSTTPPQEYGIIMLVSLQVQLAFGSTVCHTWRHIVLFSEEHCLYYCKYPWFAVICGGIVALPNEGAVLVPLAVNAPIISPSDVWSRSASWWKSNACTVVSTSE